MCKLIGICEVIKDIQTFVIASKTQTPVFQTFSKAFVLDKIASSKVYEDNEACHKIVTMPKMSSRTKHIALPYHFFHTKVIELETKVISISTHSQLADSSQKVFQQASFKQQERL